MNPVPSRKLNHVYTKHAADFGVIGLYNKANAARFKKVLHDHVNDPAMTVIVGTHRGVKAVTHYFDPAIQLNVMVDTANELESAWRLSPQQVLNLLTAANVQ